MRPKALDNARRGGEEEAMSSEPSKQPHWSIAPYFVVDDIVATANFYRDKLGFTYDRFHGETPSFTIVWRSCAMLRSVGSPGFVRPNQVPDASGDFAWDAYIWGPMRVGLRTGCFHGDHTDREL